MKCNRKTLTVFGFATMFPAGIASAVLESGEHSIRMRLEIDLVDPTCVAHQNFAFTVRIINPNDFEVILRGFEMDSYIEPDVQVMRDGVEIIRLRNRARDSAFTGHSVTIPPQGRLEKRRFAWQEILGSKWWPDQPGIYEIQARLGVNQVRLDGNGPQHPIDWEMTPILLRVHSPGVIDRRAWDWLEPRLDEYERSLRDPSPHAEDVNVKLIRLYGEFLERYSGSVYAAAIRWETGRMLMHMLRSRDIPNSDVPMMVDLLEECVTYCLNRGGAYADEFVEWDASRGGNGLVEIAIVHRRWELLSRLLKAFDEYYPQDEEGKLYRRILSAGAASSMDDARRAGDDYLLKYPDGRYRNIEGVLRVFARQRGIASEEVQRR